MWLLSILSGNDLRIIWIWQEYGKSSMLRTDSMDLSKVLAELRQELENLDAAILSLERLQQEGRRRGRPPKALSESRIPLSAPRAMLSLTMFPAGGGPMLMTVTIAPDASLS